MAPDVHVSLAPDRPVEWHWVALFTVAGAMVLLAFGTDRYSVPAAVLALGFLAVGAGLREATGFGEWVQDRTLAGTLLVWGSVVAVSFVAATVLSTRQTAGVAVGTGVHFLGLAAFRVARGYLAGG